MLSVKQERSVNTVLESLISLEMEIKARPTDCEVLALATTPSRGLASPKIGPREVGTTVKPLHSDFSRIRTYAIVSNQSPSCQMITFQVDAIPALMRASEKAPEKAAF